MSPGARQWVRWTFNAGLLLLLILPPVTCSALTAPNWIVGSLVETLLDGLAHVR